MLKIWGRANSVNVQKAVWAAAEVGVRFERLDAGLVFGKNTEDWYLALNPNGKVPLLQDGEWSLWESNVIVRYLAHCYGTGTLCPDDPQQRFTAEQWMDWTVLELLPAMTPPFWGLVRTPPEKRNWEAINAGIKECNRLFGLLDRHLQQQDYVAGNEFSMGDIPAGALVYRWYNLDIERDELLGVHAWYERLQIRSSYGKHVMLPVT